LPNRATTLVDPNIEEPIDGNGAVVVASREKSLLVLHHFRHASRSWHMEFP
jgi:hypothetical protein